VLAANYVISKQQSHTTMQHTAAMSTKRQFCMSLQGSIQIGTKALTHMQQQHAS